MNIPKISVIIPVYNTGKYLPKCVESVRNQTLSDIEIILVDDESPDNAPELCDEYAQNDKRIKVVHKKNGGLGYARNSGLDVATGEYVSFIDSDDFIKPEMMQTLYETAKRYDADDVRSGTIFYNEDRTIVRHDVDKLTIFRGADEIKSFVLDLIGPLPEEPRDVKYMMSVCLAIHRRCVIEDNHVRFTSERETLSEDMIFGLDLYPKMNCIVCIPVCFYHYRTNPNSLTHTFSMEKYKRTYNFLNLVKEKLMRKYDESEFLIHYQRLMFLYLRNNISSTINTRNSMMLKYRYLKYILSDEFWTKLISNYPYKKMNLQHCIYFWALRNKLVTLVFIANKFFI